MGVSDYILVHPFKKGLNVLKCDCVDDFKSFRPDRRKSLQDELKAAALDEARPAWLELGLRFNQIPKNQRSLDRFGSSVVLCTSASLTSLLLLLVFFACFFCLLATACYCQGPEASNLPDPSQEDNLDRMATSLVSFS